MCLGRKMTSCLVGSFQNQQAACEAEAVAPFTQIAYKVCLLLLLLLLLPPHKNKWLSSKSLSV